MNKSGIYRWAVISVILIIASQLYIVFSAFSKMEGAILLYMICTYGGALTYVYMVERYSNKRYYLIPVLLIILNIMFLFVIHVFIKAIYNIRMIFIISSAILVMSSVVLAIINYRKSTFLK